MVGQWGYHGLQTASFSSVLHTSWKCTRTKFRCTRCSLSGFSPSFDVTAPKMIEVSTLKLWNLARASIVPFSILSGHCALILASIPMILSQWHGSLWCAELHTSLPCHCWSACCWAPMPCITRLRSGLEPGHRCCWRSADRGPHHCWSALGSLWGGAGAKNGAGLSGLRWLDGIARMTEMMQGFLVTVSGLATDLSSDFSRGPLVSGDCRVAESIFN